MKDLKARRYCFTIHNYTKKDLERFHKLAESLEKHRYICYGLEVSETGTPHIQGYIELDRQQRFTYLHRYFDFKKNKEQLKFHIEIANGSAEENKKYASKDGDFYEFGEPATQGTRTDLKEIRKAIEENPRNISEIIKEYGDNLQQVKYAQIIQPYFLEQRDPEHPPTVYWIFGETGVGKTSLVFQTFDSICSVSSYDWMGTGYLQDECLLFDDFREFDLKFSEILKITDRYPYTLFYKGGQLPLNSPYIVFTTPYSINQTLKAKNEDIRQIKRRIIEICLDNIEDLSEVDLRNLHDKFIYKDDYSHHDF